MVLLLVFTILIILLTNFMIPNKAIKFIVLAISLKILMAVLIIILMEMVIIMTLAKLILVIVKVILLAIILVLLMGKLTPLTLEKSGIVKKIVQM